MTETDEPTSKWQYKVLFFTRCKSTNSILTFNIKRVAVLPKAKPDYARPYHYPHPPLLVLIWALGEIIRLKICSVSCHIYCLWFIPTSSPFETPYATLSLAVEPSPFLTYIHALSIEMPHLLLSIARPSSWQSASVNSSLRNILAVQFSRFVHYSPISNESSDILAALAQRPKFNSDDGMH